MTITEKQTSYAKDSMEMCDVSFYCVDNWLLKIKGFFRPEGRLQFETL